MAEVISTHPIENFTVYGQQMVEYSVDSTSKLDYASALGMATVSQSLALEAELSAYMNVLQLRSRKLQELGEAVAVLAKAITGMPIKDQRPSDTSPSDLDLISVQSCLQSYGIYMPLSIKYNNGVPTEAKVTRESAEKARADTEYATDKENNDMQQDMITAQGLISKRDTSFSMVSKMMDKINSTARTIISSMGV